MLRFMALWNILWFHSQRMQLENVFCGISYHLPIYLFQSNFPFQPLHYRYHYFLYIISFFLWAPFLLYIIDIIIFSNLDVKISFIMITYFICFHIIFKSTTWKTLKNKENWIYKKSDAVAIFISQDQSCNLFHNYINIIKQNCWETTHWCKMFFVFYGYNFI